VITAPEPANHAIGMEPGSEEEGMRSIERGELHGVLVHHPLQKSMIACFCDERARDMPPGVLIEQTDRPIGILGSLAEVGFPFARECTPAVVLPRKSLFYAGHRLEWYPVIRALQAMVPETLNGAVIHKDPFEFGIEQGHAKHEAVRVKSNIPDHDLFCGVADPGHPSAVAPLKHPLKRERPVQQLKFYAPSAEPWFALVTGTDGTARDRDESDECQEDPSNWHALMREDIGR
jgi:hypothetical protein